MQTETLVERLAPQSKRSFALGLAMALAVLAITVIAGALYVRTAVRRQIASRDANALYAVTMMEQLDVNADLEDGALPDEQVAFEAALLASRLKGVIGIRFFEHGGKFRDSFPANIQPRDLAQKTRERLNNLQPVYQFKPDTRLDEVFIFLPQFATGNVARAPILEVAIPLLAQGHTNLIGTAEFILDGESITLEYSHLDGHLAWLGGAAFAVGGLLLAGMLWPVFHRVQKLNTQLEQRNDRLQRANQELALAARTSALGAVSAHLMHGLKNPLASLSHLLRNQDRPETADVNATGDALQAARRMQALVEETLEVLADARGEAGYEIGLGELLQTVCARLETRFPDRKVKLRTSLKVDPQLPSRTANLLKLVLTNLAENAIQVTPDGQQVSIVSETDTDALVLTVKDQGNGFPEHLRNRLFLPCISTREGGSGLGLAISHQIAEYLGAELILAESSDLGCVFRLKLPLSSQHGTGTHSISRQAAASANS